MGVRFYDEALLKKIRSWVGDSRISIINSTDVSQMLATQADMANDQQIELPMIAITRQGFSLNSTNRDTMSSYGLTLKANPDKSEWLNAIPISLQYQVDVYTRYMDEADEYVRNMIFNIINFPRLTIELPYYDEHIEHNSSLHIQPEITDNSAIPERLIYGQFTRLTLMIDVADAYLFDMRINNNATISTQFQLHEEINQRRIVC